MYTSATGGTGLSRGRTIMDEDEAESVLLTSSDGAEPGVTDPYLEVEADQPVWQNIGGDH
jgi:hypothetical protein